MISFRASSAGGCLRKIVTEILHPDQIPPKSPRLENFLKKGHIDQEFVTQILVDGGVDIPTARLPEELEGTIRGKGFKITGHVDGLIFPDSSLTHVLEIKSITEKMFRKLEKSTDWRDVYPQYKTQIQLYAGMESLSLPSDDLHYDGPFEAISMVFHNRNTSEILQGIEEDLPGTIYRPDMLVRQNNIALGQAVLRLEEAVEYVLAKRTPETCDAEGYCFHCGQFNPIPKSRGRVVALEDDKYLENWYESYKESRAIMKAMKKKILSRFDKHKADALDVPWKRYPLQRTTIEKEGL